MHLFQRHGHCIREAQALEYMHLLPRRQHQRMGNPVTRYKNLLAEELRGRHTPQSTHLVTETIQMVQLHIRLLVGDEAPLALDLINITVLTQRVESHAYRGATYIEQGTDLILSGHLVAFLHFSGIDDISEIRQYLHIPHCVLHALPSFCSSAAFQ